MHECWLFTGGPSMQIEFNFDPVTFFKNKPVRVVKNTWSDVYHVMCGHLVWPEDVKQKCFSSIKDAVAFAKRHGANPQVGKEAFYGR